MSLNLNTIKAAVYRKLRQPSERSLADGAYIIDAAMDVIDSLVTEFNQTNEPWFLQRFTLTAQPNQEEYNIDGLAPNFGKLRFAYAADESDPSFRRYPINLVDYEVLQNYYNAGNQPMGASPYNARFLDQGMACIFDVNSGNRIVIAPIPTQLMTFRCTYEPALNRPQALQENAFRFEQFNGLVTDKIAWQCLQICSWEDFDKIEDPVARDAANSARRKDIAMYLTPTIASGEALCWQFRQSNRNQYETRHLGFARNRR